MLILIKLAAIATVVIFFQTGKNHGENGYKWALIGFIGFALGFAISMTVIGETLISLAVACIVVYLTRSQLLKMLANTRST
ncbi:membrane protein [methanotrophic bacterial endosymbiont of Bathymodiolus sp.]|jgi:uncharacterized membrane protein|nr:membrane protein [methanotrophic bacterial endosymbiont of Bathymodiolus sp.]